MTRFKAIKNYSSEKFLRDVGVSKEQFSEILTKLERYIESEKERNPLKRRGCKSSKNISLADKLLLTLYYMRHYITFAKLAQQFDISEGYSNKIYHYILDILTKILDMPNPKNLLNPAIEVVAIDVTEQAIERPKKRQKEYYSGKKKDIR